MIAASPRGVPCVVAGLLLASLVAGCATPPSDPAERAVFEQTNDPLEPLNRQTFELNLLLDRILLKPVTKVYIAIVPEEGRDALKHALDNMKEPVVVINNVLQGNLDRAGASVGRFAINSTIGIGGLLDLASKWGVDKESGDFGQTAYVWGLPEGPYLMLPILGPSNPRDLVGMGADAYMDPFSFLATTKNLDQIQITRFVLGGIDQRAQVIDVLDDLEKNSLDYYAQLRSLSQQKRAAELRHGNAAEPGANFYDDPSKTPGEKPKANLSMPGPTPAGPAAGSALMAPTAAPPASPRP